MSELKPCPFCGCDEVEAIFAYEDGKKMGVYLYCTGCLVEQGVLYKAQKEAKEAWNRRADNER